MAGSRTNSTAADLLVEVRRDLHVPLHRQIEASIREAIRSGRLRLGSAVPASRVLAADLGVSRGVVVEAYQQLIAEGYLTSRGGGYTEVATGPRPAAADTRSAPVAAPRVDFRPGRGDADHFPRSAWLRSVRRVLMETPSERFGYLGGRGAPELHEALADYLNRARGAATRPADVVVCNGYAQGLALVLGVLAARGARLVAVEDPSADTDAPAVAAAAGLSVVPIPVGDDGIDVTRLVSSGADAVILTPAHQWPTGAVLSPESRTAILQWADRTGALVIEDDYDAELRYDRAPIGAMQGVAPNRVVYAGTASKTLAPGLRLGWLALPRSLVEPVAEAKLAADRGSPVLDQLTFADFLTRGEFDRHVRRLRPLYRRRRDTLLALLAAHLPELRPTGVSAGFHLVAWLPARLAERDLIDRAARRGVALSGVSPHRVATPGPPGLIFGFGGLDESAIETGVRLLAETVGELRARD